MWCVVSGVWWLLFYIGVESGCSLSDKGLVGMCAVDCWLRGALVMTTKMMIIMMRMNVMMRMGKMIIMMDLDGSR